MDNHSVATELGRTYRFKEPQRQDFPDTFPLETLAPLIIALDESLSDLQKTYNFLCLTHVDSLDNPTFVAFLSQYPLDHIMHTLRENVELLRTERWVHHLLNAILDAFKMVDDPRFFERFAAGLPIVEALSVPQVLCFHECFDLLVFVCNVSRNMVHEPKMFRIFAETHLLKNHRRDRIMFLLVLGNFVIDTMLVEDIFLSLIRIVSKRPSKNVLHHLETLLRTNRDFRTDSRYVEHTISLCKTGWPVDTGHIVFYLLNTNNVSFAVRLDVLREFPTLIERANEYAPNHLEWRAVRSLIRAIVPGRIDFADSKPVTKLTCPISLDHMTYPVTISDGNTYEREYIMRHFATSGFISPMTRQYVEPFVFENRSAFD